MDVEEIMGKNSIDRVKLNLGKKPKSFNEDLIHFHEKMEIGRFKVKDNAKVTELFSEKTRNDLNSVFTMPKSKNGLSNVFNMNKITSKSLKNIKSDRRSRNEVMQVSHFFNMSKDKLQSQMPQNDYSGYFKMPEKMQNGMVNKNKNQSQMPHMEVAHYFNIPNTNVNIEGAKQKTDFNRFFTIGKEKDNHSDMSRFFGMQNTNTNMSRFFSIPKTNINIEGAKQKTDMSRFFTIGQQKDNHSDMSRFFGTPTTHMESVGQANEKIKSMLTTNNSNNAMRQMISGDTTSHNKGFWKAVGKVVSAKIHQAPIVQKVVNVTQDKGYVTDEQLERQKIRDENTRTQSILDTQEEAIATKLRTGKKITDAEMKRLRIAKELLRPKEVPEEEKEKTFGEKVSTVVKAVGTTINEFQPPTKTLVSIYNPKTGKKEKIYTGYNRDTTESIKLQGLRTKALIGGGGQNITYGAQMLTGGGTGSYENAAIALLRGSSGSGPAMAMNDKASMLMGKTKFSAKEPEQIQPQQIQIPEPQIQTQPVEEPVQKYVPPQPRVQEYHAPVQRPTSKGPRGQPPEPGMVWSRLSHRWVWQERRTHKGSGYEKHSGTNQTTYQPQR